MVEPGKQKKSAEKTAAPPPAPAAMVEIEMDRLAALIADNDMKTEDLQKAAVAIDKLSVLLDLKGMGDENAQPMLMLPKIMAKINENGNTIETLLGDMQSIKEKYLPA